MGTERVEKLSEIIDLGCCTCDIGMNIKIKGSVCTTVAIGYHCCRPTEWRLGAEKKAQGNKLDVAEIQMLRRICHWMCRVTLLDNEVIRCSHLLRKWAYFEEIP